MAYTKTVWVDYPLTTTPITAAALNNLETGVFEATNADTVYMNEAARDAAITSPTEGMMVYLTAPTVPAATGAITAVPTGVVTIYNGSVWVCVTAVGASTVTSGTRNNAAYGALTGGGTNPSVTLVTGTTVNISISAKVTITGGYRAAYMAFSVSGATTRAATDDDNAEFHQTSAFGGWGVEKTIQRSTFITGLTAGTNTFALEYRTGGTIITFERRSLIVTGIA